ncbi:MAG: DUF2806 domain-containing protein [Phormidium tanganyikae FI6-MK23]|nr:DUF2806 domain-containing protein [Phormidium tanganyikae FI6-MK23]
MLQWKNTVTISKIAACQIQQEAGLPEPKLNTATEISPINEDWLNNFEKHASQKSTGEMQLLFGRILAGRSKNLHRFQSELSIYWENLIVLLQISSCAFVLCAYV